MDAVSGGQDLTFNLAVLTAIGAVFIILAFIGFLRRDLPANG